MKICLLFLAISFSCNAWLSTRGRAATTTPPFETLYFGPFAFWMINMCLRWISNTLFASSNAINNRKHPHISHCYDTASLKLLLMMIMKQHMFYACDLLLWSGSLTLFLPKKYTTSWLSGLAAPVDSLTYICSPPKQSQILMKNHFIFNHKLL